MAFVYSCCFWFSLRLGGILTGCFSLLQGILSLIGFCLMQPRTDEVANEISNWINDMNLIFTKDFVENVLADPGKYITLGICLSCIYVGVSIMYIYGAYKCNIILMTSYIILELIRLLLLTSMIVIWLMVLKQNTMDIGLLIGASVAGGFFLLGMFYLWVCAANLPVLINEMERDEQITTIERLQQLLENNPRVAVHNIDTIPLAGDRYSYSKSLFTTSRFNRQFAKGFGTGAEGSIPYYQ